MEISATGKSLELARKELGMSREAFADRVRKSSQWLLNIEKGKTPLQEEHIFLILTKIPEINKGILFTDGGSAMMMKLNTALDISYSQPGKPVPFFPDLRLTTENVNIYKDHSKAASVSYDEMFSDANAFVQVYGESMSGEYKSGDRVALREIDTNVEPVYDYGNTYLIVTDNYQLLRTVRKHDTDPDSFIMLHSPNPDFDPYPLEKARIRALFIVVGHKTRESF